MKIGVTGDTHGSEQALRKILQTAPPVEMWLHTGDYARDANFLASASGLPVVRVCGNCDPDRSSYNADEIMELEGFNIWLTHGHRYLFYHNPDELARQAQILRVDIVVYGHTHVAGAKYCGGILLLNPGSPSRPRGDRGAGFAVLDVLRGTPPQVEFIALP